MASYSAFKKLGFSQYEAACYMALLREHPVNGSRLSKGSGIARSRIYDVIRSLLAKGFAIEVNQGLYAPLPPEELVNRLKTDFSGHLDAVKETLRKEAAQEPVDYIWTFTGYDPVMEKAASMIREARDEIYVRLFPQANERLEADLIRARDRGVRIRYIAMGPMEKKFDIQVRHPDCEHLPQTIGGRSIDVISDRDQALAGIFQTGNEEHSPINWSRNHWFVIANRDSLRHDFYHCFLEKTLDRKERLSPEETHIYEVIKNDD